MSITLWKPEQDVLIHQALGKACEEASELANILARCLIQGIDQYEPVSGKPNRKALSDEIADLDAAVQWLRELTGEEYDEERADRKLRGFRQWQQMLETDMSEDKQYPAPVTQMTVEEWRLNCQHLLDILDNQGFDERDLGDEDEAAIKGIRAALTTEGQP